MKKLRKFRKFYNGDESLRYRIVNFLECNPATSERKILEMLGYVYYPATGKHWSSGWESGAASPKKVIRAMMDEGFLKRGIPMAIHPDNKKPGQERRGYRYSVKFNFFNEKIATSHASLDKTLREQYPANVEGSKEFYAANIALGTTFREVIFPAPLKQEQVDFNDVHESKIYAYSTGNALMQFRLFGSKWHAANLMEPDLGGIITNESRLSAALKKVKTQFHQINIYEFCSFDEMYNAFKNKQMKSVF